VKLQTNTKFLGPFDCCKRVIKREGLIGLFSGIGPPLLISTAVNAIVFTSYNYTLKLFKPEEGEDDWKPNLIQMFLSGCTGGLAQSFITGPGELLKIRLQTNKEIKTSYGAMKKIVKTSGPLGIFRGLSATIYREVPAFGGYFTTYYTTMDLMGDRFGKILPSFIAGGLAGVVSWATIYPIDIAKSMIQMSDTSSTSTVKVLRELQQKHGWRYLYRGLGTTIVRSLPVNAVVFPVYEFVSSFLSNYVAET
jgi:solute carrier family 25 (mitochondrial carnitine/acylcarnitine transporter), member 20/29